MEFALGEVVYIQSDCQSFTKVENKKWVKLLRTVIVTTRLLTDTTYKVKYSNKKGSLSRKSVVHLKKLKGVQSQVQRDMCAKAQQKQEAQLAGLPG